MEGAWVVVLCCLWEVPEGCSCQFNILQCTLDGVNIVLYGSPFHWAIVRGVKLYV